MKICFTLDDVIRAKTKQIGIIYKKYIDPDIDLDNLEFETNDYNEIFGFNDKNEWYKFLYEDYPFDIFANAPVVEKMVDKTFANWHLRLNDLDDIDEKIEVSLANPFEFNLSIGFTYFFLSKIATRIREVFLPTNSVEIWDRCDVLVTADPKLIENKPEGKKLIKIEMPYNKDMEADFTYDSLSSLLNDDELITKLIESNE